jgi:co-chaperonin GroES (HSP10)
MKPLRDLILIKADKEQAETKSGILIVKDWVTLPLTGKVISVGTLVESVKPGDRVMFERYGSVILEDNERICKESHIIGVL